MVRVEINNVTKIDGKDVDMITCHLPNGDAIQFLNFGAIVHRWIHTDIFGQKADVLLGCKNLNDYIVEGHPYFGALIGRYANRIAWGKFVLDETEYTLNTNLNPHHLHGGNIGFDKKVMDYKITESKDEIIILFTTKSPHLEEGYPGNLSIQVTYTFSANHELRMEFKARTDQDTHVNLTNHCYFNLSGNQNQDILDHILQVQADKYTETNTMSIPTGQILDVKNTPLDFRTPKKIGAMMSLDQNFLKNTKGFDHNFVINDHDFYTSVAAIWHPDTKRRLQVFTDQPGIQLYTGNWLEGINGKAGKYRDYVGFCLETQHFPDSPNHKDFPSTLLKSDQQYYTKTIYKLDHYTD